MLDQGRLLREVSCTLSATPEETALTDTATAMTYDSAPEGKRQCDAKR